MSTSSNFFLQSSTNSICVDSTTAAAIYPILQDVHALRTLADAYDIDHFLNNSVSVSDAKSLATMSNLASDISQALHNIMQHPASDSPSTRKTDQSSKVHKSQKIATRSKLNKDSEDTKRCNSCGVTDTPCWRRRSSGRLLCNFCGLLNSRRSKCLGSARRSHISQSISCSA